MDSPLCPSCGRVINVKENCTKFSSPTPPEPRIPQEVFMVKCTSCDKCVGILGGQDEFLSLQVILRDARKVGEYGWKKVKDKIENETDGRAFFTLSQIIYKEWEMPEEAQLEVQFSVPPPTDLIKLLWINGSAVGFYTLKPKGTFDLESMECYSMVTLDTIFIRQEFRRRGFAQSAVQDILTDFPDQNIGFSYPISIPMMKVLAKNLEGRPQDRTRFWEITGCGSAGNCRNLWLILHKSGGRVQRQINSPASSSSK